MGTSKSGRYLNTRGSGRSVSDFALVHSNEGTFTRRLIFQDGKHSQRLILASGGHGQKGMELLKKYHIKYNIVKLTIMVCELGTYPITK